MLDLRGEDPEALKALGQLYTSQGNWRDLVDILERGANVADTDEDRISIFMDLGRVWYARLDRARSALESYERVLDLDPGRTPALFEIANIHRAAGATQELVDTLHRIIDVGSNTLDATSREAVHMELGKLYAETLQRSSEAVEAYTAAIDVNPRNFVAMDALERIHTEEGNWEARIGVKERRVTGLSEAADKVAVLLDIARSWTEDGSQRDQGVSALTRVVELDATARLCVQAARDDLHRRRALGAPGGALPGARRAVEDGADRIQLLMKVAKVYETKLDEPQQAFDALLRVVDRGLRVRPLGRPARTSRADGAGLESGAHHGERSTRSAESRSPRASRSACAAPSGTAASSSVPDYAIPYYQQILQLDPSHHQAMSQMADLYRQLGQWDTVYQVLARMLEVATRDEDKMDVYVQLGELCEKQLVARSKPPPTTARPSNSMAPTCLRWWLSSASIVSAASGTSWSRSSSARPASAGGELNTLSQEDLDIVLAAKLELAPSYRDHFNDIDKAIQQYEEVLAVEGQNLAALRGIEPLYQQRERWPDLPQDPRGSARGRAHREGAHHASSASSLACSRKSSSSPRRRRSDSSRFSRSTRTTWTLLSGLSRIYRTLQRWDDVLNTYERHVSATPDRTEKVAIYKALGSTYANELKDPARAIDTYLNVTNLDENDVEALDALSRLYEKTDDHASSIDALERLAKLQRDPAQQVDLHFRIGRILEEKLGERDSAVRHYERAIDIDPTHLPSLGGAAQGLRRRRRLAGGFAHPGAGDPVPHHARVLTRLNVELGQIYRERLDEYSRSVACFEAALRHDDTNEEAALPLVDDYVKAAALSARRCRSCSCW